MRSFRANGSRAGSALRTGEGEGGSGSFAAADKLQLARGGQGREPLAAAQAAPNGQYNQRPAPNNSSSGQLFDADSIMARVNQKLGL